VVRNSELNLFFGKKKTTESLSSCTLHCFSGYIAPECLRNTISTKSDVFIFGVTVLVIITARDATKLLGNDVDDSTFEIGSPDYVSTLKLVDLCSGIYTGTAVLASVCKIN
jgi:hypothetical protein